MNFRKESSILIAFVVLIINGIQGQLDDFMKICDLCNVDGLQDCNSTNIFHINMTINCEMTNKMCTLGINEFFEGFENLTLHDIDQKHICIFKEMSKNLEDIMSTNNIVFSESQEHIETTSEAFYENGHTVTSFSDESTFLKTTLRGTILEPSTMKTFSTDNYENQEITRETSLLELQDNQQNEEKDSTYFLTKTTTTVVTDSPGSFENMTLEIGEPYVDKSSEMQRDEQDDLVRSSNNNNSDGKLEKSVPEPIPPGVETVECFACESSTDEACLGRIEELKTVQCPKQSGCISYYSNNNLVRNCGSVVSPEEADMCQKPHNYSCDSCLLAKCNKKLWKQCFKCNSKDDPNCALWSMAETVPLAICPNPNDNCLVRVTKDGDTLRECSPPDAKCSQDDLCSICEGPLCNAGVYPADRLQCIQCKECEDAQDPNTALPCLHYNVNDKCFLYVTAKSRMYRGCVSNVTEMLECQNNEPKCITCGEQNGCNSVPLMKEPTLSCSKCKSKDNPSCVWEQPDTAVSKCTNKFLYYLTETCLTQFDPSSEEAVRDCSFDYGVCTSEDQDCHSCREDGCNRGSLKIQQCIQCQSDQTGQIECRNQAAGMPHTKCLQEKGTFESRGCFTITKGNVTSRGCVESLSPDDSKLCKKKGQTSCEICTKDFCNNILAPSSSSKTEYTSLFALFGLFLIVI